MIKHGVAEAGLGIDGEHHARRAEVGAHHALHADAERDLKMIEALVDAIGDGAVGEERGEAAPACLEQRVAALHVEIGLLLAGEARVGQVFGGGAAAHGDIKGMRRLRRQVGVCLSNELLKVSGDFRRHDRMPDARPALSEVFDVARIEVA